MERGELRVKDPSSRSCSSGLANRSSDLKSSPLTKLEVAEAVGIGRWQTENTDASLGINYHRAETGDRRYISSALDERRSSRPPPGIFSADLHGL